MSIFQVSAHYAEVRKSFYASGGDISGQKKRERFG